MKKEDKDPFENLLKNEYGYGNDADDMRGAGRGIDPRIMVNDMSSDAVGYAQEENGNYKVYLSKAAQ